MFKQLKTWSTIGALALAMTAPGALAAPAEADPLAGMFWTAGMMTKMDKNKDGKVTRQEFLDYMGAQFDRMDQNKDKSLDKKEFTDSKMMSTTFPAHGT